MKCFEKKRERDARKTLVNGRKKKKNGDQLSCLELLDVTWSLHTLANTRRAGRATVMAGVSRETLTGKFNGFYVEGRRTHTKFTTPRLMEVRDRWLLLLLLYHLLIASHFAFLIQSAYCFAFKCFLLDGEIVFASF